jgi:cobyrinic acid a,c-diamide synthase
VAGAGLILAAPASGSGKTLITAGLLRHLRDRGLRIAAAKAGPDYIDPTFHALASGGQCLNLDPWAMRPKTLAGLVTELESAAAELILCEGVMGLFDGTGPDGETGSTAELARRTGWPVVLVVDARRQGASAAALIAGFARHDPALPLAGIIFNRVAGGRHRELLEAAAARHLPGLPCLGAIPADAGLALPERHLGLVPANERGAGETIITRAAAAVGAAINIDRLVALARPSRLAGSGPAMPLPPLGQHIAVARDDAFLFAYPATLAGWRQQGAARRRAARSGGRCDLPAGRLPRAACRQTGRRGALPRRASQGCGCWIGNLRRVRRLYAARRKPRRCRWRRVSHGRAVAAGDQLRRT